MSRRMSKLFRVSIMSGVAAVALLALAPPSQARVTRIIIDLTMSLTGQDIPYERVIPDRER